MNKEKHALALRIGLKAAGAALLLLILLIAVISAVQLIAEGDEPGEAELIGWCERDYYARDYARLYETLTLYGLYGERYAGYWEAVNAYREACAVEQWVRAAQLGIDGAAEQMEENLASLRARAAAPQDERNGALLRAFAEQAEELTIDN
ncbi:MAG: hypothetical protein PUD73_05425 [bacterium]|nr:hypothetical protein [bacterium]